MSLLLINGSSFRVRIVLFIAMSLLLVPLGNAVADTLDETDELASLSLEELLSTEITTLSRKAESLGSAPAAVYVISQSDIRRSGATSIPELLRHVPGMQVAQIDGNKWAVTSRGANGRFANKLLVLMDGRTLYNPLLSGVFWDTQDTDLATIERIEVIRGPGATMWGSNAVNGVVNIITKHAADTQGGNLSVTGGQNSLESALRYGGASGDLAYRAFAKVFDRDGNVNIAGDDVGDESKMARVGGRIDWDREDGAELTISSELYSGDSGEHRIFRSLIPPYEITGDGNTEVSGAFLLTRWSKALSDTSDIEVRAYLDSHERDGETYTEELDTIDIDIQHRFSAGERHDLMWGINYRYADSHTEGTFEIELMPADRTQKLISAFIQDDIRLSDATRVIVGSKFENNNLSDDDLEISPSIRFVTEVGQHGAMWAALSRAVRMPSRGEIDGRVVSAVLPPGQPSFPLPVPLVPVVNGNPDMQSEDVTTYELGYRMRRDNLIVDLAVFYNDFDNLRSLVNGAPICQPSGVIVQVDPTCLATATHVESPLLIQNEAEAETTGLEISASRQLREWWRLHGVYTYFHLQDSDSGSVGPQLAIVEDSPDHQVTLRSSMDFNQNIELDIWLRWVDELESQQIEAYTALDLRIAWSPTPSLIVAGGGRNLLAGDHLEFMSELVDLAPVEIEPEAYVNVRWSF